MDFYFNYGLTRASVLAYVLCANLVIFVYLFMTIGITVTIDPLVSAASTRRFLELHFLWPMPDERLLERVPEDFPLRQGDIVSFEKFETVLKEYSQKINIPIEEIVKQEDKFKVPKFSITSELAKTICNSVAAFYADKSSNIQPLGVGLFLTLSIAYIALMLSVKTNLAESVSPLIWGNLPLHSRKSEIMKILWRLPDPNLIKSRVYLFFMLPILGTLTISVMSAGHSFVELLLPRYTKGNIVVTALFSWAVTTALFAIIYELHVSGISKKNAVWGAMIAAALWLGGRWFITTYGAVSLFRNLRNFALLPLFLTWFYYFCTVFLFGLYVADTLENPNLTSTSRGWVMRDISWSSRYAMLSTWVRLDFLYRLALSRYEEYRPPFIGIKVEDDSAAEIARKSNLHPSFVRECILEMLLRHRKTFHVEIEGNRQYCKLKSPPEEIEVTILLSNGESEAQTVLDEMGGYIFGEFILQKFGVMWQAKPMMLSEVYQIYKKFLEKKQSEIENIPQI